MKRRLHDLRDRNNLLSINSDPKSYADLLTRSRILKEVERFDSERLSESINSHINWKVKIYEPILKRIEGKLRERMLRNSTDSSSHNERPVALREQTVDDPVRILAELDEVLGSRKSERSSNNHDMRLSPTEWNRVHYDSTLSGMQSRFKSTPPPSRIRTHSSCISEFPRGKRIISLPSQFYRRNPLLLV